MEHQLLLASLCLAAIVTIAAFFVPSLRGDAAALPPEGRLRPAEIAAAILPFLGFLICLPTHKPFAAGQGLGTGFLVGGITALVGALAARRTRTHVAGGAVLALPALAVALPLLLMRPVLIDALLGVATGAFVVGFLLYLARRDEATGNSTAILASVGVTVTLAATAVLGTFRDAVTDDLARGTWAIAAVVFTAGASLFALIAETLRGTARRGESQNRGVGAATGFGALGLMAILAVFLGTKFVDDKRLIAVFVIGIALYPLIAWLQRGRAGGAALSSATLLIRQFGDASPFLGVLLIVCAVMVGGQLLQGFGFALAVVALFAAWAAMGGSSSGNPATIRLLLFGAALALYRTFLGRWGETLHGVNLDDQYALFGFAVGAAVPHLTAALAGAARRGSAEGMRPLFSATIAGVLALAVPGAVVLLFGTKCALALLIGAALSGVFAERALPILIAIAMTLALDQWNDRLTPYEDISRFVKLKALVVVFAVVLVVIAVGAGQPQGDGASDASEASNTAAGDAGDEGAAL